jgi:hypothetical protein
MNLRESDSMIALYLTLCFSSLMLHRVISYAKFIMKVMGLLAHSIINGSFPFNTIFHSANTKHISI